jgi:hypothetical protein
VGGRGQLAGELVEAILAAGDEDQLVAAIGELSGELLPQPR